MKPAGKEGFFAILIHTSDGKMVFFARNQPDAVIVDGSDFTESDLEAVVWIAWAVEYQPARVEY